MKTRFLGIILIFILMLSLIPMPLLEGEPEFPWLGLNAGDFERIAVNGFGKGLNNSYSWAIAYFNGKLYIGTGSIGTIFQAAIKYIIGLLNITLPSEIEEGLKKYPPFITDWANMTGPPGQWEVINYTAYLEWREANRAEIWRYNGSSWEMVYRSPLVNRTAWFKNANATHPILVSREMGIRIMKVFNNTLYAGAGGLAGVIFRTGSLLLESVDGETWNVVPTPPQMGCDVRALEVHNGKLYVASREVTFYGGGNALIWASDNPGVSPWTLVANLTRNDPPSSGNTGVISLASFNGYLYAGTENIKYGFEVWRSNVSDPTDPINDWVKIVEYGAGDMMNYWAGTMKVYNGTLYVGSMLWPIMKEDENITFMPRGFDLIRVYANDSWDLLVGAYFPRRPPPGYPDFRVPKSLWPAGFGNPFNIYVWWMEEYDGVLYLGTMDWSTILHFMPTSLLMELLGGEYGINGLINETINEFSAALSQLEDMGVDENYIESLEDSIELLQSIASNPNASSLELLKEVFLRCFGGADLWKTVDGILWVPVTLNGFGNSFNYGIRVMQATDGPNGYLYVGTANPFNGTEVLYAPKPLETRVWIDKNKNGVNDLEDLNFTRIQSAVIAADQGDWIFTEPGVYYEHVFINGKAVNLTSTQGPALTKIVGSIDVGGAGFSGDLRIHGFTIECDTCFLCPLCGSISLAFIHPEDASWTGKIIFEDNILVYHGIGIGAIHVEDQFYALGGNINGLPGTRLILRGNTVNCSWALIGSGIVLEYVFDALVEENTVFSHLLGAGACISGSMFVDFKNNTIRDNAYGGLILAPSLTRTSNLRIFGNSFENNGHLYGLLRPLFTILNETLLNETLLSIPIVRGLGWNIAILNNSVISDTIQLNYNTFTNTTIIRGHLAVFEKFSDTINATYNDWGFYTVHEIEDVVYHHFDDPRLDVVIFAPWLYPSNESSGIAISIEHLPSGSTDHVVETATEDAKVVAYVDTVGNVAFELTLYTMNPEPEAEIPANTTLSGYGFDINLNDTDAISWPIYIELHYPDDVENEETLAVYYYNKTANSWMRCSNTGVDVENNIVWAYISKDEYLAEMGSRFNILHGEIEIVGGLIQVVGEDVEANTILTPILLLLAVFVSAKAVYTWNSRKR